MKEYAIFQILKNNSTRIPYSPQVEEETFSRLAIAAFEGGISRKPVERTGGIIQIRALLPNTTLEQVIEVLRTAGWHPVRGHVSNDTNNRYQVRIAREYGAADLDGAEYLYVESVWGEWPITSFVMRDGDRWVGDVRRVGIHSGLGWTQRIGYVDGVYNYFVGDGVRDAMLRNELRGVRFHPLQWNQPEEAKGCFWELDLTVLMPSCNLPVADIDGTLFYEENGYCPVELEFRATDVRALGTFDVAWCREQIGDLTKGNSGRHVLVVSQKFRQVIIELGLADLVVFYPVRLA